MRRRAIPPPILFKILTIIGIQLYRFGNSYDKTIHELGADDYGKFDSTQDK